MKRAFNIVAAVILAATPVVAQVRPAPEALSVLIANSPLATIPYGAAVIPVVQNSQLRHIPIEGAGGVMLTDASNATLPTARTNLGASVTGGVWPGSLGGAGVANTGKTITLGGSLVSGGALTTTGIGPTTLIFPGSSASFTFPSASATLASLGGTETLTNKTLTAPVLTGATSAPTLATNASNVIVAATASATSQTTAANPSGTLNLTGKMAGLAGSITPASTGTVAVTIAGNATNNTISYGTKIQLSYGTGTAPSNGDAITGTQCGSRPTAINGDTVITFPIAATCVITGLSVGTAYWLDVTEAAITGGTATLGNAVITAYEIR